MSGNYNFNNEHRAIRAAFDEAKVLLESGKIDMFQYRTLCNDLLNEVKMMDTKYNNEDIREMLNSFIDRTERDKTIKD
ncbi:hypothetical protein [Aquimarina algicola]|uniref:Uncharacterized protein n=1 Tax=Aquimarina algicola TaxID=2589995 RepID=A0A504J982_9FLAO|nr:hypothetical protein [Aquimarina algicola]TPN87437.1 hypothetical protein FHK87_07600 [Aquimarina algicola]